MAPSRTFGRRSRLLAVTGVVALTASLVQTGPSAQAADPGNGTVSPAKQTTSWQGQFYGVAATADPTACPPKSGDPANAVCDHFTLKVPVEKSYWKGRAGGAEVTVTWPDASDDFDLYVYKDDQLVASSASGGTTKETAVVPKAFGTYEVRVLPFLVSDSAYDGSVSFETRTDSGAAPRLSGPKEYHGTIFRDFNCKQAPCLPDKEPQNKNIKTPFPSLVLKQGPVGRDSAEPTIAVDKKGRAFYPAATFDGAGGVLADTRLLKSTDDGSSWKDITPPVEDLPVTLDPYVYIEEDSGRLFNLDLYAGSSFLQFSDDGGKTFETNPVASGDFVNDHQTMSAGPKPKGFPFESLDPDFPEFLYYCFNRVADASCGRSIDGGRTFEKSGAPAYPGVEPMEGGAFCGGLHGHVVADRSGRVFLPKGHCGRPYISVSKDAGTTWTRGRVSDRIDMPDNQSSVAADAFGNLYYVWYDSEHRLPWLAVSKDHGKTWGDPIMIAPPGVREVQWPTIAAGGKGNIAISFPGTNVKDQSDLTRPWDYHVVMSVDALTKNPTFVSNISNPPKDPVHRGDCPGRCGNMLDFLDVLVSPAAGHPVWATVVDTCTDKDNCNTNEDAEGFSDANGNGVATDMRGLWVRQISGPRARW